MIDRQLTLAYAEMVSNLAKPGHQIVGSLTLLSAHILRMAVGVTGEAGELLDAAKKHAIYNKPLDHRSMIEELGDLEFYMEGLRAALGVSREEVLEANMAKLSVRFASGKYSNEQAQARADKENGQ